MEFQNQEHKNIYEVLDQTRRQKPNREYIPNSLEIRGVNDELRGVDEGYQHLVEFLNTNGFSTVAMCSAKLSDHHDISQLSEHVTADELFDFYLHNPILFKTPWVRIEPKYHTYQESKIVVNYKFKKLRRTLKCYRINNDDITIEPRWLLREQRDRNRLYNIEPDYLNQYKLLKEADSLYDYDESIDMAIQSLEEGFYRFVNNGYELPQEVDGRFQTIEQSELSLRG